MRKLTARQKSLRAAKFAEAMKRFDAKLGTSEDLWEHQDRAMGAVSRFLHKSLEKIRAGKEASGAIVMPTGSGKTLLAAEIANALGLRALILAPTVQIALQHIQELNERAPEISSSIYYSDEKDLSGKIIVSTYQSAVQMFKSRKLPKDIGIVFYDEAHESMSPERSKLYGKVGFIDLGLTATPAYDEDRHIWNAFDEVIYKMHVREGIESGILSPLRGYIVDTRIDVTGVRLKIGRTYLNERAAEYHLNVIARNQSARDFYLDRFKGVPAVAFCLTQQHAEQFAAYLNASDVKATFIHGGVTGKQREDRLKAFDDGSIDVLTSRDVLLKGWDSQRLLLELNLRPTYSRVVKTHMVGRVIRARPNKESGIVVEFQDQYSRSQQPILVHHLFDQMGYRQGGLIAAPKRKMQEEEQNLRKCKEITVVGDPKVSYSVTITVNYTRLKTPVIEQKPTVLDDPELLRDILETCEEGSWGIGFRWAPMMDRDFDYSDLLDHVRYDELPKIYADVEEMAHDIQNKNGFWELHDIDPRKVAWAEFKSYHFDHPEFSGTGSRLVCRTLGISTSMASKLSAEDFRTFLSFVYGDELLEADEAQAFYDLQDESEGPFETTVAANLKDKVRRELLTLTPREENVLRRRFGLGNYKEQTRQEAAEEFEVSRARIRQLEGQALRKMRHPSRAKSLLDFYQMPIEKIDDLLATVQDETRPDYVRNVVAEILITECRLLRASKGAELLLRLTANDRLSTKIRVQAAMSYVDILNPRFYEMPLFEQMTPTLTIAETPDMPHEAVRIALNTITQKYLRYIDYANNLSALPVIDFRLPETVKKVLRPKLVEQGLRLIETASRNELSIASYDETLPWELRDAAKDALRSQMP